MCGSLSTAVSRRIERKRTRTQGRNNRPSTETVFLSLSRSVPFSSFVHVVLPVVLPVVLHRSLPLAAVAWKTLQCEMLSPRVALFGSLLVSLLLYVCTFFYHSLLLSSSFSWLRASSFFSVHSRFSVPSLSLIAPPQLSASGSFQLVPAETFHRPRPPFSAFFPSGFFSPPRTFLACLIPGLFFNGRKSRVKIIEPNILNISVFTINVK